MRCLVVFLILITVIFLIEAAPTKKDEEELRIHHKKKKKRPCKDRDGRTLLFVGDIVINQIAGGGYIPGSYLGGNPRPGLGLFPCSSNHFSNHFQHGGHSQHGGLFHGNGLFSGMHGVLGSGGLFNGGGLLSGLGIPSLFGNGGWFGGVGAGGTGGGGGYKPKPQASKPQADNAPEVHEDAPHDEVFEDYYKPGPIVGAPSQEVGGYMQDLSHVLSTPTKFVQGVGKGAYSYLINPFVELLQKKR